MFSEPGAIGRPTHGRDALTTATLFRILGRRWYVIIAGLLLSWLAFSSASQNPGVYSTQVDVIFVAPGDQAVGNVDSNVETLVAFAAAIEREILDGKPANRLVSDSVSLYSAGVDQGYQVSLANTGVQWQTDFSRPALSVKVVGPSQKWVRATLATLLNRIDAAAHDQQAKSGSSPQNMITTAQAPTVAEIQHVGSDRAMRFRALAAILALGAASSVVAAVLLDRLILRLRAPSRRRKPHPTSIAQPFRPQGERAS